MKKCWAKQVEGHEHDMLGKDQVHKQHDFPELAGFVVLGYFGLVFWLGLIWGFFGCGFFFFCQRFPSSHHTRSVFVLPAPKADPLPPHSLLKPLTENFLVSADLELTLFLVAGAMLCFG